MQKKHTSAVEQSGPNFPPRPEAYMFGVMYKGLLFQLMDVILSCTYLDKHSIFASWVIKQRKHPTGIEKREPSHKDQDIIGILV